jgi:uncharacterized Zn ribbon protein
VACIFLVRPSCPACQSHRTVQTAQDDVNEKLCCPDCHHVWVKAITTVVVANRSYPLDRRGLMLATNAGRQPQQAGQNTPAAQNRAV